MLCIASVWDTAMAMVTSGCCSMNAEWTHPVCGFGIRQTSGLWNTSLSVDLRVTQVPELCACELMCISQEGYPLLYIEDLTCDTTGTPNRARCTLPALQDTGLHLGGCAKWAVAALDDAGYGDFCYLSMENGTVLDGTVWTQETGEWSCHLPHICPPPPPTQPPTQAPTQAPVGVANDTFHVRPGPGPIGEAPPALPLEASPVTKNETPIWPWIAGFAAGWAIITAAIFLFKKKGPLHCIVTKTRHRLCGSKRARRKNEQEKGVEMVALIEDGSRAPQMGDTSDESGGGLTDSMDTAPIVDDVLPPPRAVGLLDPLPEPEVVPAPEASGPPNPDPLPEPMVVVATPATPKKPKPFVRKVLPPGPHEPAL